MANFPSIQKPFISTPHTVQDNSLKSEMVNGMQITRPRYSRQLRNFSLSWNALPSTDLTTLLTFYNTCKGGSVSFVWVDDLGNSRNVRFDGDLDYSLVAKDVFKVSLKLQEV